MNLLNNVFNIDEIEIKQTNRRYIILLLIILVLIFSLLIIKKDYYYEDNLLINADNVILIVDKSIVNIIKNKTKILVNKIESDYSINKIIDQENTCYIDINLNTSIISGSDTKYKILLGKETIFEYIIRIIKKVV